MSLTLTLILLAAAAATTVLSAWRGAQPPNLMKGPRMTPWRLIMITAAAMIMLLLVHLATLLGLRTDA